MSPAISRQIAVSDRTRLALITLQRCAARAHAPRIGYPGALSPAHELHACIRAEDPRRKAQREPRYQETLKPAPAVGTETSGALAVGERVMTTLPIYQPRTLHYEFSLHTYADQHDEPRSQGEQGGCPDRGRWAG